MPFDEVAADIAGREEKRDNRKTRSGRAKPFQGSVVMAFSHRNEILKPAYSVSSDSLRRSPFLSFPVTVTS